MRTTVLLPAAFCGLFALACGKHLIALAQPPAPSPISTLRSASPPQETGTWPSEWIAGLDCASDPSIQVHKYNDDFFVLRQSKCEIYEAPFMYLLFGTERALLLDTGALAPSPVGPVVLNIVRRHAQAKGIAPLPVVVAHTHGHFDHVQGDFWFTGQPPGIEAFIPAEHPQTLSFWGFQDYPQDSPTIDLGNRVIDLLGSPGHYPTEVSFYDRNTQILITGDIVYPGHLFVFAPDLWDDFVASIQRLVDFASENPVQWVVGCHIETAATPFSPFAYGTTAHPNEHPLQMNPIILQKVLDAALEQGPDPECTIYDEFVIHPVYKCGITWNG